MLTGRQILLTEDQEINQEIFLEILEGSGMVIDIASNGEEAIRKFRQNDYALIVMDIEMPIMNGYEATKIIRLEDNHVPIIALTTNNTQQDIFKSLQMGMNEHLTKPIEAKILYQTFSKYIA